MSSHTPLAVLLLSMLLSAAEAFYCTCQCGKSPSFVAGDSTNCNDFCFTQNQLYAPAGYYTKCADGTLSYSQLDNTQRWIYIGSGIASVVVFLTLVIVFRKGIMAGKVKMPVLQQMRPENGQPKYQADGYAQPNYQAIEDGQPVYQAMEGGQTMYQGGGRPMYQDGQSMYQDGQPKC
ncbi:hypothetical protein HDU81_011171 [Chytriomyces hyalinus]|nr:hypothetical protein HDU81_011171 [Chytriomyces hyalinus]